MCCLRRCGGLVLISAGLLGLVLVRPSFAPRDDETHFSHRIQRWQESQRQRALRDLSLQELARIRQEAARDFEQLRIVHRASTHARLHRAVSAWSSQAQSRISAYADWMLTYEATVLIAHAWWNDQLPQTLASCGDEQWLHLAGLERALQAESSLAGVELAQEAAIICQKHDARIASVLATLPGSRAVPNLSGMQLPASPGAYDPAVQANAGGVASFISSTLAADQFAAWLAKKLGLKAGSKVVRAGTGPIGWAVSLLGGMALESAADRYWIKPRLVREFTGQLALIEAHLLGKESPIHGILRAHDAVLVSVVEQLTRPLHQFSAALAIHERL